MEPVVGPSLAPSGGHELLPLRGVLLEDAAVVAGEEPDAALPVRQEDRRVLVGMRGALGGGLCWTGRHTDVDEQTGLVGEIRADDVEVSLRVVRGPVQGLVRVAVRPPLLPEPDRYSPLRGDSAFPFGKAFCPAR